MCVCVCVCLCVLPSAQEWTLIATNCSIGSVNTTRAYWGGDDFKRTCRVSGRAGASLVNRNGMLHTLNSIVSTSTICVFKRSVESCVSEIKSLEIFQRTHHYPNNTLAPGFSTYSPAHMHRRSRLDDQGLPPLPHVLLRLHAVRLHHLRARTPIAG